MAHKGRFPKIQPELYEKITLTELVVYAMYFLHEPGREITPDDIISSSFRLFPKKFALAKYPQWPDSAVVGRRWSDCRAKGLLSGDTTKGFKLTSKGIRLAERVGKKLGIAKPVEEVKPSKTKKPAKKTAKVTRRKKSVKKPKTAKQVEKQAATTKSGKTGKKSSVEKPVKKQRKVKAVKKAAKRTVPKKPKATRARKPRKKTVTTKPVRKEAVVAKVKKKQVRRKAKAAQPVRKAKKRQKPKVIVAQPVPASRAPQIDKARAGKFVRMMETSDAYLHYKKNGNKAKISEFDFRSMLLCTLESSPETLARNVALFKGYAEVYHRKDLITFLDFCEENFASILTHASRQPVKKRSG